MLSTLKAIWKRLGGGRDSADAAEARAAVEYKGYRIRPAPYPAKGQYQTAGIIEKEIAGVRKEHRFIRSDRFSSLDDAVSFSITKARQIVDLQGERIFD